MRLLVRLFIVLIVINLAVALAAGGAVVWLLRHADATGPLQAERVVPVPRGAGTVRIAEALHETGVIEHKLTFRALAKWRGQERDLKAGEYQFTPGISLGEVLDKITAGDVVTYAVTIAEGLSVVQILDQLASEEVLSGEIETVPAEGSLLPETYQVLRGDTREAVITRMQLAQQELLEELWPGRAADLPFDTPREAVVLASIVEKETGVADERPRVAAVFVNRLRRGMRLESDPTIIYGVTSGYPLGRRIRRSELDDASNPYNTYRNDGLPPTPIANPGRDAIAAVLNPPATDDLFFVADGTGGHVFARTYAEHNANVRKWRRIQEERGLR